MTNTTTTANKNQPFDIDELTARATDKRYSTVQVASKELLALINAYQSATTAQATPAALRLTESKTRTIEQKGYKITGYVLTHEDGRKAISDMQAVRWLDQGEFWKIMHPTNEGQDGLLA